MRPIAQALVAALSGADVAYEVLRSGVTVRNLTPAEIGVIAADAGIALSSLQRKGPALEEVFLELVSGARVHASAQDGARGGGHRGAADAAAAAVPVVAPEATGEPEAAPATTDPESETPIAESPEAAAPEHAAESTSETEAAPTQAEPAAPFATGPTTASFATSAAGLTEATGASGPAPVDLEAPHAFAVATTGVIDVVPPSTEWTADDGVLPEEASGAPIDADVDVEAIGEIDDELSAPDDGAPEDRPFDTYDKTESDVDADAFFSAFDASQNDVDSDTAPTSVVTREGESAEEIEHETEEFGALVDEKDVHDADDRTDTEGGEQR